MMEAREKALEMLNLKQCIKEVQAKMNYCVQMNNHDGDESFEYWNDVMKELLIFANQKTKNLVNSIDPEKKYPVSYTIKQDGTKVYENTFLLGKDLTEKQILQLEHFNSLTPNK